MREMIERLMRHRPCGVVRVGYVTMRPGDHVGACAGRLGLSTDPAVYFEVPRAIARARITSVLMRDLAYGHQLATPDAAEALADEVMRHLSDDHGVWYTNSATEEGSWQAATEATFDQGALVMCGTYAAGIWAEDED